MTIDEAVQKIGKGNYKDIEQLNGKENSICSFCGVKESINHKGKRVRFSRMFNKTSWFRGEDEYLGIACFMCVRAITNGVGYSK